MESDFLVNIVKTLATAFVFVATLWAILLPSIREDRGRGSSILWAVLFTIILALSAVYLLISYGPLIGAELSSGESESQASDISIISVVMTFVWLITFWAVGFGVLKALSDLSYPRGYFDAIKQDDDATKD